MFNKKLQRFSIRKLTIGAVSILIGLSFMAVNENNQVQAATEAPVISQNGKSTLEQLQENVNQKQIAYDKAKENNAQTKIAIDKGLSEIDINKAQEIVNTIPQVLDETNKRVNQNQEQLKNKNTEAIELGNNLTKNKNTLNDAKQQRIKAQNNVKNASDNVKNAQNMVEAANKKARAASDFYNKQNKNSIAAEENKDKAAKILAEATVKLQIAQQDYDKANQPGVLEAARDRVKNKTSDLNSKKADLNKLEQSLPIIEESINKASSDVEQKTQALAHAQKIKSQRDSETKAAKDALDNVRLPEIKAAHAEAVKNVEQRNIELSTAQNNLIAKTNEQKQAASTVIDDQKKSDAIAKQITSLQADYDAKKSISDEATAIAQAKKAKLDKINNKLNYLRDMTKNTIVIPDLDKYKQAFIDYETTKTATQSDIEYFKEAFSKNSFQSSDYDKNNIVEVNNLTDDQLEEASLFAADLMGKARAYFGWPNDKVTRGSLTFARAVAKRHIDDQWLGHWHYGIAINDVAKKMGLRSNEGINPDTDQFYEERTWWMDYNHIATMSMNELKREIYDSLLNMLIPANANGYDNPNQTTGSYEMGHAKGVLGIIVRNNQVESEGNGEKEWYEDLLNKIKDTEFTGAKGYYNNFYFDIHEGVNGLIYSVNGQTVTKEQLIKILEKRIRNATGARYVSAIPSNVTSGEGQFVIHEFIVHPNDINQGSIFSTEEIPSYNEQIEDLT
uniref:SEC10/PgrA surface exclusion domain-containing protein n=1 Tax=Lactobacillus taiwanensis TaxID=508451 RepID=UPI002558233E